MAVKILLGTTNKHKISEYEQLFTHYELEKFGYELFTIDDLIEVEEDGTTCIENAKIKAKAYADKYNCIVIADDTGIFIDRLNGAPGVHSKRYKGATDVESSVRSIVYDLICDVDEKISTTLDTGFNANYTTAIAISVPSIHGPMVMIEQNKLHGKFFITPDGEYSDILYDKHFRINSLGGYIAIASLDGYVKRTARAEAFNKIAQFLKYNTFSS